MQTFTLHGLIAPEPLRGAPDTFGRRSPRRYGRACPPPSTGLPGAHAGPRREDDAPRWVDQEFEETMFE